MALSLVTGSTGTPHVTSEQMRELYKGFTGENAGCILSSIGGGLQCTVNDATHVTVASGGAILPDGAYVYNDSPVTLKLDSGTSGRNRCDTVFIYWTTLNGSEVARIDVRKGDTTTGTPEPKPLLPGDNSLALWYVYYTGVSITVVNRACRAIAGFSEYDANADLVIEKYISDDPTVWSWTKWRSGRMECWVDVNFGVSGTHAVNTAMGSLYRSSAIIGGALEYPFEFAALPNVQATIGNGGAWGWVMPQGDNSAQRGSTTKPGGWFIVRGTSSSSVTGSIHIYATGRWA